MLHQSMMPSAAREGFGPLNVLREGQLGSHLSDSDAGVQSKLVFHPFAVVNDTFFEAAIVIAPPVAKLRL
ncbi:hypothetical protein QP179_19295 [Sphingomonas aurantiaca]|uniref:hypothetical protein n=1 Tax=Sphingomonas aurantiaca TaxID=185949 RepID=UPI002FE29D43